MRSEALRTIKRYDMLSFNDRVTVALSGGADSVALLHFLCSLREDWNLTVSACHINHLLRGSESEHDEDFVRFLCRNLDVPLLCFREDVAGYAKKEGISLEQAGRRIRYRKLFEAADGDKVATAHTLSDRAETTVLNMLRGTGLKGLCSIPPVQGRIIRPLIFCTREQVENYCLENSLTFVNDSTNFSDDFTRNRIRQKVIPAMCDVQPAFYSVYRRLLDHLDEDEQFLHRIATEAFEQAWKGDYLDTSAIKNLPEAVLFRVLREYFFRQRLSYDTSLIEKTEKMLQKGSGQIKIKKNLSLCLSQNSLSFVTDTTSEPPHPVLVFPGDLPENPFATGRLMLVNYEQFQNLQKHDCNILRNTIDYDKICGTLILRRRLAGDYLRLAGRRVGKPLNKWWNEQKVPVWKRDRIPVLADETSLVWVPGLGTDQRVAPGKETLRFLIVEIEEAI